MAEGREREEASSLRDSLARRRASLRETLKLKQQQEQDATIGVATTSFSGGDAPSLLTDLRERRRRRRGQLPPLESTSIDTDTIPPKLDTVEPFETSTPPSTPPLSHPSPPPPSHPPSHGLTHGSSMSLSSTVRERLRSKLQVMQSERDLPTSPDPPPPERRLRSLRSKPRVTRFDEPPLELQTREEDSPSPSHPTLPPSRWRVLATRMTDTVQRTVEQDAYDFFTGAIEDLALPEATPKPGEEGANEEVDGEEEREEMDTSALIEQEEVDGERGDGEGEGSEEPPMITEEFGDLLHPRRVFYTPQRQRLERENVTYFIPSTQPVTAEEKTPGSLPPRYLEDEGFYVGERPRVRWTNQVAVENRFLRRNDKGEGWFGEDGLLLCQPNPLRQIHIRPPVLQCCEGTEEIQFGKAKVENFNQKLIDRGSDGGTYQLDIDVSSLHFSHHPLFTSEHVLASRLEQSCEQFKKRAKNNSVEYYSDKLQALKMAISDLKQTLQEMDPTSLEAPDFASRLEEYRREVRMIRQQRKNEEAIDYTLLKNTLRTWQEIKALRETQGYSSTTLWLTVRRHPTNAIEDESLLRRDIEEELSEQWEDFEVGNAERVARYEAQLAEWKSYQKTRRRAIRRVVAQQQSQPGTDQSGAEGSQASLDQTADLTASDIPPERPRPIPPPTFSEVHVRQQLVEYYKQNRRSPGEPVLVPELHHSHAITQQCPRPEHQRRDEVSRVRFHVKVVFNDREVSATREGTLSADFSIYYGEIFNIRIVQWPESIKFQVYESGLLTSTLLAEVYVPIPDPQLSSNSPVMEEYQFSANRDISYGHTAVGSGDVHPSIPEAGVLVTTGTLRVGVCWGVDEHGRVMCPRGFRQPLEFYSPHTDAISCLGVAGIADLQEVKKWIEQAKLDPNDPRNADLLQLVQSVPSSADEAQYFRLMEVDDRERFTTDEEFGTNRRFKLLEMRDQGHPGLKNKRLPLNAESITESVWKSAHDYKPYSDYDLPLTFFGDFHSARKEEQNKFLLDVRERVLSRVRSGRSDLTLSDVVHFDIIPNISALKNTVVELFSPRRPLKPQRRGRRRLKPQNVHVSSADIVVRVVRAFNVPIRTLQDTAGSRARPMSAVHRPSLTVGASTSGPLQLGVSQSAISTQQGEMTLTGLQEENLNLVCPYVEIAFGEEVKRTTTACGPNPFWNEELSLTFHPPHDDFSPANLQKVTEVLQISLFDEVIIDILQDDRQRATNIHHRLEKRWLGSFTLPFSTLHSRARIEGTFRLDVPLVLLGYEQNTNPANQPATLTDLSSSGHTHIQLFIAIEPPLSVLPPIKDQFDSNEDLHLLQHASVWLRKLRESFPSRHYTATALDISGRHVFVTRFVRPQNPPPELTPPEDANRTPLLMEQLAHYVSLIPFLPDAITFSGACDIWTTSDQFLHMLGGDEEEHALLLCNYFLHCGWRAWMVLGHAIPEGPTAYVLTESPHGGVGYWLWNPSTGKHYGQHEAYSPLTSVGCVISNQNIWANIQDYEDPSRIVFNLENTKHWRPLFQTDMQPLATVQQDLQYAETDLEKVQELQERIERTVREHIMSLRSRFITRWNRHCTRKLQSLLPRFEENFSSPLLHEHHTELAEITASYKLVGFPIHLRYSDIQHIVSTIARTGVHLCENEHVEYALAVYIHPYPNDVLSVWLYIASLIPK